MFSPRHRECPSSPALLPYRSPTTRTRSAASGEALGDAKHAPALVAQNCPNPVKSLGLSGEGFMR
eukprot:3292947-Alexandrium_andersonii.AAC.1